MGEMESYLDEQHAVVLKGPTGSGKTWAAYQYCKKNQVKPFFAHSSSQIKEWLKKPDNNEPKVLIVDEANLKQSGVWEFLAPILQILPNVSRSSVHYQGGSYDLFPQHRVIFTANPTHYGAGRAVHRILQNVPTVYVKKWSDTALKEYIVRPLLPSEEKKIPPHPVA